MDIITNEKMLEEMKTILENFDNKTIVNFICYTRGELLKTNTINKQNEILEKSLFRVKKLIKNKYVIETLETYEVFNQLTEEIQNEIINNYSKQDFVDSYKEGARLTNELYFMTPNEYFECWEEMKQTIEFFNNTEV